MKISHKHKSLLFDKGNLKLMAPSSLCVKLFLSKSCFSDHRGRQSGFQRFSCVLELEKVFFHNIDKSNLYFSYDDDRVNDDDNNDYNYDFNNNRKFQ